MNNKQFEIAVLTLTGSNGIFKATNENNKVCFATSITIKDSFIQTKIPPDAYELKRLKIEFLKTIFEEEKFH